MQHPAVKNKPCFCGAFRVKARDTFFKIHRDAASLKRNPWTLRLQFTSVSISRGECLGTQVEH